MNRLAALIPEAIATHEKQFPQSKVYGISGREEADCFVVELSASHFSQVVIYKTLKNPAVCYMQARFGREISEGQIKQIRRRLTQGFKIEAIKEVQAATGLSREDATAFVESEVVQSLVK